MRELLTRYSCGAGWRAGEGISISSPSPARRPVSVHYSLSFPHMAYCRQSAVRCVDGRAPGQSPACLPASHRTPAHRWLSFTSSLLGSPTRLRDPHAAAWAAAAVPPNSRALGRPLTSAVAIYSIFPYRSIDSWISGILSSARAVAASTVQYDWSLSLLYSTISISCLPPAAHLAGCTSSAAAGGHLQ